jgi:hypothetical protein
MNQCGLWIIFQSSALSRIKISFSLRETQTLGYINAQMYKKGTLLKVGFIFAKVTSEQQQ